MSSAEALDSPPDAAAEEDPPEAVTPEEVQRLAHLAHLTFSDEEAEALTGDLNRLLDYAQQLGEVDTAGVRPMPPGAPSASGGRLRADEPEKPLSQTEALENAPDTEEGFFCVPSTL